jgi:type II secretory pathway component PulJ
MPLLSWGAVMVFFSLLGLLFLHYKMQISGVASETERLEREYMALRQQNEILRADLDNLKAPQEIKRRIRSYNFVSINEVPVIYMQRNNDRVATRNGGGVR